MADKFTEFQTITAYQTLFLNNPSGKMVLADLGKQCFVDQLSADITNPHHTYFNEGRRSIYLYILDQLKISPVDFLTEQSEMENLYDD